MNCNRISIQGNRHDHEHNNKNKIKIKNIFKKNHFQVISFSLNT